MNLHLDSIVVKNVSENSSAARELEQASGGSQAPCLVIAGEATAEHVAIIAKLLSGAVPL